MEEKITQLIAPGARELIDKHKLAGDLCIIITATNYFVTAPIVRMLGIDHLIATEPEQKNGNLLATFQEFLASKKGK